MNANFVILLFSFHLLGDYYLQSQQLSELKKTHFNYLLLHIVIYSVSILGINLFYRNVFVLSLVLILSHACIDGLFFKYRKYLERFNAGKQEKRSGLDRARILNANEFKFYIFDQTLHLITLLASIYIFMNYNLMSVEITIFTKNITQLFTFYQIEGESVIKIIFSLMLLHKPMNVFITLFLNKFMTDELIEEKSTQEINAGRYIGTLERIIIAGLVYLQQFSAIGLVLTAKSITRHKKIVEEPSFGEYYLLGTFLSFILVMIASLLIL